MQSALLSCLSIAERYVDICTDEAAKDGLKEIISTAKTAVYNVKIYHQDNEIEKGKLNG